MMMIIMMNDRELCEGEKLAIFNEEMLFNLKLALKIKKLN